LSEEQFREEIAKLAGELVAWVKVNALAHAGLLCFAVDVAPGVHEISADFYAALADAKRLDAGE
jgi:hypothetical protein